jgi:hypothetical protein
MMRNLIAIYRNGGSPDRADMLASLVELLLVGRPSPEKS